MEMNAETIADILIPRLRETRGEKCPPIYVTMAPALAEIPSWEGSFERLIEQFLGHLLDISHPFGSIRIGVHKKKKASDLEQFLKISPGHWIHMNIKSQSVSGFDDGIKEILRKLGYHCHEWIGMEGSESQLGAFHFEGREAPSLVLFIQNHGSHRSCDFLIPVVESDS